jgi:hypothetical protein
MGDGTRHPSSGLLRVGEALPFCLVVRGWATWDGSLCSIHGEWQKIRLPLRMRLFGFSVAMVARQGIVAEGPGYETLSAPLSR